MYVGKPINLSEPDLLIGRQRQPLSFEDSSGNILDVFAAPRSGWTHALIERVYSHLMIDKYHGVYDIYLGYQWVGSSEV